MKPKSANLDTERGFNKHDILNGTVMRYVHPTKTKYLTLGVVSKSHIPLRSMVWCDLMEHVFISGHVISASTFENPLLTTGHVVFKVSHKSTILHVLLILSVEVLIIIVVAMFRIVIIG